VISEPLVLTVEEAAKLLRIGRTAAYEAARRGELPTIRVGRSIRVPRAALDRMLAGDVPAVPDVPHLRAVGR
jgi:excisionase family DNA binding protein